MEPTRERSEAERIQEYKNFDTAEKMFDKIQQSYDNGDKVIVTYNKEFGYPENIRIEPKRGGVDTRFSIVISNFEIIKN